MSSVSCRAAILSAAFALTTAAPALAQYCTPTVTTPCLGNEYISNVSVGTINNSTLCGLGYEDFSSTLSTIVVQATNVPITATVSSFFSGDQVSVFCDWNANGLLDDAGEVTTLVDPGTHVYAGVIAVPASAVVGSTRMRVRLNWNAVPPACGNTGYGNAEDYTLVVNPTSSPTNPSVTGTATPSTCLQGNVVVLAATVVPGQNPTSTGLAVSGDLTGMGGGPAVALLDDGIAPDVAAGDNIFTTQATVPLTQPDGPVSIALTVSDAQARVGTGNTGFQAGYCAATSTYYSCSGDEYISNVVVGAINNTSPCGVSYENFTTLSTNVSQAGQASISVTVSTWYTSDQVAVFCDWNVNGLLDDPGEVTSLVSMGLGVYSGTILVPPTATLGATRMRVRMVFAAAPLACGNSSYGNTEDYTVVVGPPAPPANDACASAAAMAATQFGTTALATNDGSSTCDPTGNDVWFAYTMGPVAGGVQFDTCGSSVDTVLSVYGACGGAQLACDDNGASCGSGAAYVTVSLTAGQTVLVRVSDKGAGGAYVVNSAMLPPSSQCVTPIGGGGLIPTSGTGGGGVYPTTLPPSQLDLPLAVTVPAGATQIVDIKLNSLTHTFAGDVQFTLEDPSGTSHNLLGRVGGGNDWSGDYVIYEAFGDDMATVATTPIPAGAYIQNFGGWPDGTNNIFNTALSLIPVTSGTYTLHVYDWAGGDVGVLTSWEICFNTPSGPTTYCTPNAPGTSHSCVPTIAGTANPNVAHTGTCVITVSTVEGQQSGIVFYGLNSWSAPWCSQPGGNSFLCVKAPLERTGVQNSGGTFGACDGTLTLDWNAFQLAHPGGVLGNPWSVGDKAYLQGWFRDPPSCKTTFLSEALELTYLP